MPLLLLHTLDHSIIVNVFCLIFLVTCRKHAVAGCTAGLVSVLALHPLDVVKTRLQGKVACWVEFVPSNPNTLWMEIVNNFYACSSPRWCGWSAACVPWDKRCNPSNYSGGKLASPVCRHSTSSSGRRWAFAHGHMLCICSGSSHAY